MSSLDNKWDFLFTNPAKTTANANKEIAANQLAEQQRQYDITQSNYLSEIAAKQSAASQMGSGLSSLVNSYNTAFNEAKATNANRYNEMLSVADTNSGQQAADTISAYQGKQSTALQNLAKLGMGNTTVGATLAQGNLREQQAALNTIADTAAATKLGIMGTKVDVANSPDVSAVTSLINALGTSTGSYGAGAISDAIKNLKF